jgi:hypothetical protein
VPSFTISRDVIVCKKLSVKLVAALKLDNVVYSATGDVYIVVLDVLELGDVIALPSYYYQIRNLICVRTECLVM